MMTWRLFLKKQYLAVLTVCIGLLASYQATAAIDYDCVQPCELPDCVCASPEIPGGLLPQDTPQFVLITVDDALNQSSFDFTNHILTEGYTNPNGSPLPLTYYVSTKYTNYHLAQQRYAAGCEIAVHTMSHDTNSSSDFSKWRAEIVGARRALSALAQIPMDDIVGFRAPGLAYADAGFKVLWEEGFLYESSISERFGNLSSDGGTFIWPYTLDNGAGQACSSQCPKQPYPGLFEVPMWGIHNEAGNLTGLMDPVGSESELLAMFKRLYTERYDGNRAPLGIFLHPGWLATPGNQNALKAFIQWAYNKDAQATWFVTNRQLVQWVKDPHSIAEMENFEWVQYTRPPSGDEVPDGFDNNGNEQIDEGFVTRCSFNESWFETCATCPDAYPGPVLTERNLSLEAAAVAVSSSDYSDQFNASKANDGIAHTPWANASSDATPYLYVDLGAEYDVTQIKIRWHGEYFATQFKIAAKVEGEWVFGTVAGEGGIDNFDISKYGIKSRYVGIQLLAGPKFVFGVDELEVWGY